MGLWQRNNGNRSRIWQLSFGLDRGDGVRQRTVSTRCTDRRAAQEVQRRVHQLIDCHVSGIQPGPDLKAWLLRIPSRLRGTLAKLGLLSADQAAIGKSVAQHVDDYIEDCRHHGQSSMHVQNKKSQLTRLVEVTGVQRLIDLQRDMFRMYLHTMKKEGKSHRTVNQHQTTAVTLLNWCVDQGHLVVNPLARMPRLDEWQDQRRKRRAATENEVEALLAATPLPRRTCYLMAVMTGLRRAELRGLVLADVNLDAATLTVRPEVSKTKRRSVLPLHPQVVEVLRVHWPAGASSLAPLFSSVPRMLTFQRDLQAAGVAWEDEQGRRLDLHALRKTFATRLIQKHVPLSMVKRLTRHQSTAVLEKHYDGLEQADVVRAVARLDPLRLPNCGSSVCSSGSCV